MKALVLVGAIVAAGLMVGCAGIAHAPVVPGVGFIYSDFQSPMQVDYNKAVAGNKVGEATSQDILGWVCIGDASVKAAAAMGNITTINHVDYKFYNILGIYSKFTTVVYGD